LFTYTAKRIVYMLPTIIVVAVVAFLIVHLIPGDPASTLLGTEASPEQIAELNKALGLDRPIYEQFFYWSLHLLQGNFGESLTLKQPVISLILQRMPITLQLASFSLLISLLIGIPAGVFSAIKQGTVFEQLILILALLGLAMPDFWLGLNLVSFLSVEHKVFPTGGYVPMSHGLGQWLRYMFLPAFSLGFIHAALITRMTRSAMLDVMRQDYIKTARAKGLSEFFVVMKHALKNASIPIVTVVGLSVTVLLGGAVVVENVYSIPGLGRLILTAVKSRDFPVIQGSIIFIAILSVLVNLVVDLIYKYINPKIRFE
jgi:peptide/nickel transport system permease protein